MNIKQYEYLVNIGIINRFDGGVYAAFYNRKLDKTDDDITFLDKDLTVNIDINNVIILFPLRTSYYGDTIKITREMLWIDYSLYYLNIKDYLSKCGIKYKNGDKMNNNKYSQHGFSMLIIQDGIAYVSDTASPLNKFKSNYDTIFSDIYANSDDNLNMENKEILFSGIFNHRL